MVQRLRRHAIAALCGALLVLPFWPQAVGARAQAGARRPLSYDAFDYWRAIGGTTLSRDGEWLAYALTSQGADGELVVRNLRSGAELKHPRGVSPAFTPDGRFVIFTIAQTKDEEEKAAKETAAAGAETPGPNQNQPRNNAPRTSAGVMALPGGEVTTVERIGAFSLPSESSTWVAFHRRSDAGGGGQNPDGTPRGKRKDPGADLVVRNLTTGLDVTIPLVTGFAWAKDGSWLAYAVSSTKAEEDGVFARKTSDFSVVTLQKGKGNYKALAFDEAGRQLAFVSDQAEYDKEVSPYRLYYWKTGEPSATELVSSATRDVPSPTCSSGRPDRPQLRRRGKRQERIHHGGNGGNGDNLAISLFAPLTLW